MIHLFFKKDSFFFLKVMPYLVCLLAALFFAYELVQFHMMNVLSPYLMKDLHMHATAFGKLCATYLLADVIFLLPAGIILDYFSTRKVILFGLCSCVLGTFGFAYAQNFLQASLCHFVSGIGNAFCLLSGLMLVSRWFEAEKRPLIMSLVVTIGMLGAMVAQSPFSMLANAFTWRVALILDGSVGLGLLLLIFIFVLDNPNQMKDAVTKSNISFWKGIYQSVFNLQNVLLGLYTSWTNMPLFVLGAVWGSLFLTQVHHVSLTMASFITGMISFGTIIGSTLYGYLVSRFQNPRYWMIFGALSSLVVMLGIMLLPHPSEKILTLLFFLLGLFTSSQVISYPLLSENNPRELTGTSMAVAAVIIMGLPMFVQPLSGFLLDLNWVGTLQNGSPFYSRENFLTAFSLFPLGLLIALFSALPIKAKKAHPLPA